MKKPATAARPDASPPVYRKSASPGLVVLAGVSLLFFALVRAFYAGLDATPPGTVDSAGRPMEFNDPLSPEHLLIALRHATSSGTVAALGVYDWVLVAAHLLVIALLLTPRPRKWLARLCWSQVLLFPLGLFGVAVLITAPFGPIGRGTVDRETFTDAAGFVCIDQGFWLLTSLIIGWRVSRKIKPPASPDHS